MLLRLLERRTEDWVWEFEVAYGNGLRAGVGGNTFAGRLPLRHRNQAASVFGLRFLQVDNHAVQVVVKPGRQLFAQPPDFFKKVVLHDTHFNKSSLGMPLTGISHAVSRQASSSSDQSLE